MKETVLRNEIWTVDLGDSVGSEQRGHKYCLVIQNDKGNQYSPTTIVAPITSQDKNFHLTHVKIEDVLPETSFILCEQMRVVDKKRLQNRVTKVDNKVMQDVARKIRFQLEI